MSESERRELRELLIELREGFEEDADDALCGDIDDDGQELSLSEDDLSTLDAFDAEDGLLGLEFRALVDAANRWSRRQLRPAATRAERL